MCQIWDCREGEEKLGEFYGEGVATFLTLFIMSI